MARDVCMLTILYHIPMTNNVVNFLSLLCGFAIYEKIKTEIFMSENNGILYLRIIPPEIIALLLIDHKMSSLIRPKL